MLDQRGSSEHQMSEIGMSCRAQKKRLTSQKGGYQTGDEARGVVNYVADIAIFNIGATFFLENFEANWLDNDIYRFKRVNIRVTNERSKLRTKSHYEDREKTYQDQLINQC